MHYIEPMTQLDIFYDLMNYHSKGIAYAASRRVFGKKDTYKATRLFEELNKSIYKTSVESLRSKPMKASIPNVDKMITKMQI